MNLNLSIVVILLPPIVLTLELICSAYCACLVARLRQGSDFDIRPAFDHLCLYLSLVVNSEFHLSSWSNLSQCLASVSVCAYSAYHLAYHLELIAIFLCICGFLCLHLIILAFLSIIYHIRPMFKVSFSRVHKCL